MLRASHRVLRPGGILAFLVIALPEGMSREQLGCPVDFGPDWVDAGYGYASLTRGAGFDDVKVTDVTNEYLDTLEAWIGAWEVEEKTLEHLLGAEEFSERQKRRRRSRIAIRESMLRRYLVTAIR